MFTSHCWDPEHQQQGPGGESWHIVQCLYFSSLGALDIRFPSDLHQCLQLFMPV